MKKLLFLALITGATLSSCSKKSTPTPKATNTVTINGTSYGTVSIGTQTWTSVNYNGSGGVNYGNSSTNIPTYGKLYTLAEANAITLPTGWRLPTITDYNKLIRSLGAVPTAVVIAGTDSAYTVTASIIDALTSKTGWTTTGSTNSSGFNAYPAGDYNYDGGANPSPYMDMGTDAVFLTTSTYLYGNTLIHGAFDIAFPDANGDPAYAALNDVITGSDDRGSIRFVKDN